MHDHKLNQMLMDDAKKRGQVRLLHRTTMYVAISLIFLATLASGCAIQYFDRATGTEHLWGIGHMRMKVGQATEGVRAVVTGTDTLGIAAGSVASARRITVGWERISQIQVIGEDTAVSLEWPTSDLFSVRVGSELPLQLEKERDDKEKQTQKP